MSNYIKIVETLKSYKIEDKMFEKDEWTQEELIENKKILQEQGIDVVLVDTILKDINGAQTITYNPFEMREYPKGTVFVFYCDTGKSTKERLNFYRSKLPEYKCFSLRGGRAYWKASLRFK